MQNLINVPIDYYVTINMGALSKIVDAVGGVDVDVPFSFQYDWRNFKKGPMHLNGVEALAYSRMRYQDPDYDYGRQKRQQQVIKGIVKSAMSLKTLGNFEKIMKTLSGSVATNMSFETWSVFTKNIMLPLRPLKVITSKAAMPPLTVVPIKWPLLRNYSEYRINCGAARTGHGNPR